MRRRLANWNRSAGTAFVLSAQAALVIVVLVAWEYLPPWAYAHGVGFLDPYFVSSPSDVSRVMWSMAKGSGSLGQVVIWPYLGTTLLAAAEGAVIGMILGGLSGLILSNYTTLRRIFAPFVTLLNAVPRIALIPIIVIIVGPTETSAVVTSVLVTYFLVFFNALEGGRNVAPEILQNIRIFGASSTKIMLDVRAPYVLAWISAALPNILSFSLISVVTAEILTGSTGVGKILTAAVFNAQVGQTYALAAYLGIAGVIFVSGAEVVRRRVFHWWVSE
jgi:NitT/TauT family transport system permease protein